MIDPSPTAAGDEMSASLQLHSTPDPLASLAGGGEMGQRIRDFDWSATSLGSIENWPQSLRSALSICLNSNFPIAIYWGRELVLLYNDEWSPIPGEKHPGVLGRSAHEAWPEIWHIIAPLFDRVMTTGEATRSRDQLLPMHRHGFTEECYFDYTFSPIRGEGGNVEGIFNAVLETTTRVIGERRLRTLRELGASKTSEMWSAEEACRAAAAIVADNPHDLPFALLYLLDASGQRATLAGLTGLGRDTPASPISIDLDAPDVPWPFRQVVASGEPVEVAALPTAVGQLPGGAWPEATQRAVVLPLTRSGQSQLAGFVVAGVSPRLALNDEYRGFLDLLAGHIAAAIAKARAYEEERQRAEALAELDRAKTAFFSNVSHEFRTPLTLMLGPVEDALSGSDEQLSPAQRERLEVVRRNGHRLQRLVNTLLDFSRIEAGRVQATFEPTDLAALTADLASNFRSACEKAGLHLSVDCKPLSEPAFVDPLLWEKIVLNLMSNAFKYTFEGEIDVSTRQVGNRAEVRIRDTGIGIPNEELPRLFERFHRVENVRGRTHEGSGIGLAMVHELVKLHGGSISAESELGRGTTFVVSIPLGFDHLPPNRVNRKRTPTSPTAGSNPFVEEALRWLPSESRDEYGLEDASVVSTSFKEHRADDTRPRVLVVDDNADMRQYVARLLADQYVVESAGDGESALALIRKRPPDLVVSDVMMPRLDGFGLLRELRADPHTAGLPIILLSARAGEESRVEGMAAGADDYLIKPFSARELHARVSAQIQLSRLRRESRESLRQMEERFQSFMNNSPTSAYIKDAEGRYIYVNRIVEQHFDRPVAEWVGRNDFEIFPPDEAEAIRQNDRSVLTSRQPARYEETFHRPDGRRHYLSFKFPLQDRDGSLLLAGVSADITEQRQADELLRQAERRFRAVFNQQFQFMAILSRDGIVVEANEMCFQVTGVKREDVLDRPLWDAPWWNRLPATQEQWKRLISEALQTGGPVTGELDYLMADGSPRFATGIVTGLRDESGRVTTLIVEGRDESDRKQAEAALARASCVGGRWPRHCRIWSGPIFRTANATG